MQTQIKHIIANNLIEITLDRSNFSNNGGFETLPAMKAGGWRGFIQKLQFQKLVASKRPSSTYVGDHRLGPIVTNQMDPRQSGSILLQQQKVPCSNTPLAKEMLLS